MPAQTLRRFAVLWLGQAVSLVGAGLTAFALGVHVYQTTGSVRAFTLIQLMAFAPSAVLSPLAGALTDRWDRRRVLIACDLAAAVVPLALACALRDGRGALWHIVLACGALSTLGAFQWPAFAALTTALVPADQLGRATGATEAARGVAQIFSPLTAAIALSSGVSISALLVLDAASYVSSALVIAAVVRGPVVSGRARGPAASIGRDIARGWRYLRARHDLLVLWGFVTFTNLSCGVVELCITPRVLSIASQVALGGVALVAGLGMVLGGAVMSAWRGARRPFQLVLIVTLAQGVLLVAAGMSRGLVLLTVAAFGYMLSVPIGMGSNQAIWLGAVPLDMQGSVLGLRRTLELGAIPIAALVAGPLVEHVFAPIAASTNPAARAFASLVAPTGGQDIALMFVGLGGVTVLVSCLAIGLAGRFAPRAQVREVAS